VRRRAAPPVPLAGLTNVSLPSATLKYARGVFGLCHDPTRDVARKARNDPPTIDEAYLVRLFQDIEVPRPESLDFDGTGNSLSASSIYLRIGSD
jgi:hypothetical protein